AIRFLGDLVGRSRGEDGMAADTGRFVHQEGRADGPALEARQRSRGAGVENGDHHLGRRLAQGAPKLAVVEALVAPDQPRFVGMSRVVEEELHALTACARGAHPPEEGGPGREKVLAAGIEEDHDVLVGDAPELAQQPRHGGRVLAGVAEAGSGGTAVVGAHTEEEALRGALGPSDEGHEDGEKESEPGGSWERHRVSPGLRRRKVAWSKSRGSGSRLACAGRPRATSRTTSIGKGSSAATKKKRSKSGASSSS